MILCLALRKVRKRSLVLRGKARRRAAREGRVVGRASLLNVTWLELFCACGCESDGVGGDWRTCQPVNIKPQRTHTQSWGLTSVEHAGRSLTVLCVTPSVLCILCEGQLHRPVMSLDHR